jgi:hypothetical protein
MVTDKKITFTALARYRLGTALIWLGVMTWLPFILLRIAGENPPLHAFSCLRSLEKCCIKYEHMLLTLDLIRKP